MECACLRKVSGWLGSPVPQKRGRSNLAVTCRLTTTPRGTVCCRQSKQHPSSQPLIRAWICMDRLPNCSLILGQRLRRWLKIDQQFEKCSQGKVRSICWGYFWVPLSSHVISRHPIKNTKHLYDICTMLVRRRRRWADVLQMLQKYFQDIKRKITKKRHSWVLRRSHYTRKYKCD